MRYHWIWFLAWAAFLAGICIVRNAVTGKKQKLILEKTETEARQKIAVVDQYQKNIIEKCDLLLLENDNICKKKREYDLIEIKTLLFPVLCKIYPDSTNLNDFFSLQ